MDDPRTIKRSLRDALRTRILVMPIEERSREELALLDHLPTLPGFREAKTVLLYASVFPEEFDTAPMLRLALDLKKRLLCPRVIRSERRLALFTIGDLPGDFTRGTLGIPEPRAGLVEVDPVEVDWALVPGLGYDPRCFRIGRGAGHYDRLLTKLRPDAPRWSLCLSTQWVDSLPVEPHDQPVDGVADPARTVTRT
ncbi:MAG TPA: 5-formyltetrahydrofolate cyclo-ligase [Isosphaeraceae bacterium]|jgi:5-formyltetrahydrofolate cyclo-ligase